MSKKVKFGLRSAILWVVLLVVLAYAGQWKQEAVEASDNKVGDAKKGVVRILAMYGDDGATGSGFGVGKAGKNTDIFVTNRHVVWDYDHDRLAESVYILLSDDAFKVTRSGAQLNPEYMVECEVLYPSESDPEYPDMAIIKAKRPIEGRVALPLKRMMDSEESVGGSKVYAVGYPGTADDMGVSADRTEQVIYADAEKSTVTDGTISRTLRYGEADDTYVIQHTAHINHGNSGGPLITEDGEVCGINTYKFDSSGADPEVAEYNLAVYIDYAMNKLDDLGISYDVGSGSSSSALEPWMIIVLVASVVLVVGAVVVVLLLKKRNEAVPVAQTAATNFQASAQSGMGRVAPPGGQPGGMPGASRTSALRLQGTSGYYGNRRFPIDGRVRIGRNPAENDLVYPANTRGISGKHCQLLVENGTLFLQDVGSSYGTYCKGTKLQPGQKVPLQPGDSFYLGQPSESFQIDVTIR